MIGVILLKKRKKEKTLETVRAVAEQPGQLQRETVSLSIVAEVSWMLTC